MRVALHLPTDIRVWHRNYYEVIVRTPRAAGKIAEYIQMNPWRCVTNLGNGLRGMGNPALWNARKMGVLCSRNSAQPSAIPAAQVYMGGFHSPMEKEIFAKLLKDAKPLIWCPAWGLDRTAFMPGVHEALEQNRMLVLEMHNDNGDLAAARERNAFVMQASEELWIPHVSPNGILSFLFSPLYISVNSCNSWANPIRNPFRMRSN